MALDLSYPYRPLPLKKTNNYSNIKMKGLRLSSCGAPAAVNGGPLRRLLAAGGPCSKYRGPPLCVLPHMQLTRRVLQLLRRWAGS